MPGHVQCPFGFLAESASENILFSSSGRLYPNVALHPETIKTIRD